MTWWRIVRFEHNFGDLMPTDRAYVAGTVAEVIR